MFFLRRYEIVLVGIGERFGGFQIGDSKLQYKIIGIYAEREKQSTRSCYPRQDKRKKYLG